MFSLVLLTTTMAMPLADLMPAPSMMSMVSAKPTASDILRMAKADEYAWYVAVGPDGHLDETKLVESVHSYRCTPAEFDQYRCTVRFQGMFGQKITRHMMVVKSSDTWVLSDPQPENLK